MGFWNIIKDFFRGASGVQENKRIRELEEENRRLRAELNSSEELIAKNDAYWSKTADGKLDGPFCTVCKDKEGKLIRMHQGGNPAYVRCQACKSAYVKAYPERNHSPMTSPRRRNPGL